MEQKKEDDFLNTVRNLKNNVFLTDDRRQPINIQNTNNQVQDNRFSFTKKQDNNIVITVETPTKKLMSGKDTIYSFLDDIFYYHPEKKKEDYKALEDIYYKMINASDSRKEQMIVQLYNLLVYFNIKLSFLTKTLVSTSYEVFIGIFIRLLLISCRLGGGFLSFMGPDSLSYLLNVAGITDVYIKTLISILIGICAYQTDNRSLLSQTKVNVKENINPNVISSIYSTNIANRYPDNATKETFSSNKANIMEDILKMKSTKRDDTTQF
jgi:hypothetical protein